MNTEQIMQAVEDYANALVLERSEDEVRSDEVMRRIRHASACRVSLKSAVEALVQERDVLQGQINIFVDSSYRIAKSNQQLRDERDALDAEATRLSDHATELRTRRDKLAAENKVLRDALKGLMEWQVKNVECWDNPAYDAARAALKGETK